MECGVFQLRKVCLSFCPRYDDARHVLFFIDHVLDRWQMRHPHVKVEFTEWNNAQPEAVFFYADRTVLRRSLLKLTPPKIEIVLNTGSNQSTALDTLSQSGPRVWTLSRTVQGMWQPSSEWYMGTIRRILPRNPYDFHPNPTSIKSTLAQSAVKDAVSDMRVPTYSEESIELSRKALDGEGRYGSNFDFHKGASLEHTNAVLLSPFKSSV